MPPAPPLHPAGRVRAIDWLRGLSVIFMIECHALVFLRPELELSAFWINLQNVNGLVSTAFLFASGFAGGLVGARAAKDGATRRRRTRRTFLRLAEVVAVAMYFNYVSRPVIRRPVTLLRVDILMCIAYGVVIVWAVLNLSRGRNRAAVAVLATLSLAVLAATPWAAGYHGAEWLTGLLNNTTPLNGVSGSMFPLFPWLVYPLLGAAFGILTAHPTAGRARLAWATGSLVVVCAALSLPPLADRVWGPLETQGSLFWTSNAVERLWKLNALIFVLLTIEHFAAPLAGTVVPRLLRPIDRVLDYFSRHALTGYFAHLSLLYGIAGFTFVNAWHHASTWGQFAWRMPLMIAGTAALCYVGHVARRSLEDDLRAYAAKRKVARPVPSPGTPGEG